MIVEIPDVEAVTVQISSLPETESSTMIVNGKELGQPAVRVIVIDVSVLLIGALNVLATALDE